MKIELKNLKIAAHLSEETTAYSATIHVDGKRAFDARNDGHGGADRYHPLPGYTGPSEQEIKDRLEEMLQYLKPDQLWVNPDCGLKTRQWKETKVALTNMVNAAKFFREKYSKSA